MEKYKLTKEEREMVKEIGLFRIRAKKRIVNYKLPETLIAHLYFDEYEKTEATGEITPGNIEDTYETDLTMYSNRVRKSLEEELKLCKEIQSKDIMSIIAKDKPTDKLGYKGLETKLRSYVEKKVKPYLKEYASMLKKAIEISKKTKQQKKG